MFKGITSPIAAHCINTDRYKRTASDAIVTQQRLTMHVSQESKELSVEHKRKALIFHASVLPSGSRGELPQPSLMTMGAKARRPSTQCFLMFSKMLRGKWMCRSHRNTML